MNSPKKVRLSKYSKHRLCLILSGLKAAKPYLCTEKGAQNITSNKRRNICGAISVANTKNKIDWEAASAATDFIMDLLDPHAYFESYLFGIGYDASQSKTQELRHAWLDALVKQLKDYLGE